MRVASIPEAVASSYDASEPADHASNNANPAADIAGTTGSTPLVQQDTEVPPPLVQLPAAMPTTEEANRGQHTNKKRVKLTGKQQHLRNVKTQEFAIRTVAFAMKNGINEDSAIAMATDNAQSFAKNLSGNFLDSAKRGLAKSPPLPPPSLPLPPHSAMRSPPEV